MRKLLTLAVATLFASSAFANYDLATKAEKAGNLAAEINYFYSDSGVTRTDATHNVGLDLQYGVMEGLSLGLLMPVYTKDAPDEFIPSNPWLSAIYDVNEMFAVKFAAELAFFRDNYYTSDGVTLTGDKSYNFYLAGVMNMPLADGMKFFAEVGLPMGTKFADGADDSFGLAVAVKPGIEYSADQLVAQLYLDFQELVTPDTEMYFGLAVNFDYNINEASTVFLGSSMAFSGNKFASDGSWLMNGQDEFGYTIMAGYRHNLAL